MQVTFTEGDLEERKFLGEGQFLCCVSHIEHKTSKNGDPMIEVQMTDEWSGKTTRDWFLTTKNKFKLGGFAIAAGVAKNLLLAGQFKTEDLQGKKIMVSRKITGQDSEGRNSYENSYSAPASQPASAQPKDDGLPF